MNIQASTRDLAGVVQTILSYGPGIELLEPLELRLEVARWLKQAISNYSKNGA